MSQLQFDIILYCLGAYFLLRLNSLYIFGLYRTMHMEFLDEDHPECGAIEHSKNLLWFITDWSVRHLGWHASKPIATCPTCMASVHSIYIYWPIALLVGFQLWMIPAYIVYVCCLAGWNWMELEKLAK